MIAAVHEKPARRAPTLPALVEGEFPFTQADLRAIAAMLREDAGIEVPDAKAALVYARLAKRVRALGLGSFAEYCAYLSGPDGDAERQSMLSALTTNVTNFFRESHHFAHLRDQAMVALWPEAERRGGIRLWSAACSTGQEAYSLAMTVLEHAPPAAARNLRILATDIDPAVLAHAEAGVYEAEDLASVPFALRQRWFEPRPGGAWQAGPTLRGLITFRPLNLVRGAWPFRKQFDAIFCRNVAIYFDEATKTALWSRLAANLVPGGFLYIGHSERLGGPAAGEFMLVGNTAYRKRHRGGDAPRAEVR